MARVQMDGEGVESPPILVKIYKLVYSGSEGVRGSRPPRNVRDDFSDRLNPGIFVRVGVGVSWVWPLRGGRKSWEWEERVRVGIWTPEPLYPVMGLKIWTPNDNITWSTPTSFSTIRALGVAKSWIWL